MCVHCVLNIIMCSVQPPRRSSEVGPERKSEAHEPLNINLSPEMEILTLENINIGNENISRRYELSNIYNA